MRDIHIQLNEQEFNDLLTVLEDAPYKKVQHLIHLLHQQLDNKEDIESNTVPSNDNESKAFQTGDRVKVRWLKGSTWYTGTIQSFKNNSYFIKYDDGDEEWTTAEFIEPLFKPGNANASQNFNIGDRVQVRWRGGAAWYNGRIDEISGNQYFIKFDDGDEEWTTVEFMIKI